ncbi:MAG: exosortase [Pirellulales bacterium]
MKQDRSSTFSISSILAQPKAIVAGLLLGAAFLWAYWPTLAAMVAVWDKEPDYSHGYFVAPLAIYFLWARRDRFPAGSLAPSWFGLGLIVLSVALRIVSGLFFLGAVDGWSMLLWLGGTCWLFGGWRFFTWSLPSVAFLWFMIPLPFRFERLLSWPLQRVATYASTWLLQCLGQPALAEGNTILLGDYQLEVAQACSGLRMFMGIVALVAAYIVIVRGPWWQKVLLAASVVPVALAANVLRLTATGLLYQWVSGEAAKTFSHDAAGWVMIPVAAALLGLILWYLSRLMIEVESSDRRKRIGRGELV